MEVPQDPNELRLAIAAALGIAPDRCGQPHTADAYRYALRRAWERMQAVVGVLGARAIVVHAIQIASKLHTKAALVEVDDGGPDLSKLEAALEAAGEEELCRCLKELYAATLQTVRELTGEVVIGPLLDELRERRGNG